MSTHTILVSLNEIGRLKEVTAAAAALGFAVADDLPDHVVVSGRGWVVGGGISPAKLRETTGIDLPTPAAGGLYRHLSDWVVGLRAQPLRVGGVTEKDGVRVVVRKVRRHKVLEAQVEKVGS